MKVLYLHPAAAFGGASKSLLELYRVLRDRGVEGTVLMPAGTAAQAFRDAGMRVIEVTGLPQLDNTRYGFYRGMRWLVLLRELFFSLPALRALWRLRQEKFDLIHANEITLLPLALIAKKWLKIPLVTHVRSLQRKPGTGARTRWVNKALRERVDGVIPIDLSVARTLEPDLPVTVVRNGMHIDLNSTHVDATSANRPVTVGFLGVLLPYKGIYEFVEAARILVQERGRHVRFWIGGENARDLRGLKGYLLRKLGFAADVRAEVERRIAEYGLQDCVQMLGFVKDVRTVYSQLDLLCFPSYLDAAGRPVFEAALHGLPSIVAVTDPPPDSIDHGRTGLAIERPDPRILADAIDVLILDPALRGEMGQQGRAWAQRYFDIDSNAEAAFALYRKVVVRAEDRK